VRLGFFLTEELPVTEGILELLEYGPIDDVFFLTDGDDDGGLVTAIVNDFGDDLALGVTFGDFTLKG
jgi:hypothetical protein